MAFGTQSAKIRTATTWEPSTNMVLYIVERSISMKITLLFIRVQSSLSVSIALVCSFCVLSCASLLPTLSFRIGLSSGTFRFNHQVNAIVHSISYKKSNLFFLATFMHRHLLPYIHSFVLCWASLGTKELMHFTVRYHLNITESLNDWTGDFFSFPINCWVISINNCFRSCPTINQNHWINTKKRLNCYRSRCWCLLSDGMFLSSDSTEDESTHLDFVQNLELMEFVCQLFQFR